MLVDQTVTVTRKSDESTGQSLENLVVNPGPVVESLKVADAHQLDEIVVPAQVLCQHGQVVGVIGLGLVLAGPTGHVELGPDDGLDPMIAGLEIELDGPEHIAAVRQCESMIALLRRGSHKLVDAARGVQE